MFVKIGYNCNLVNCRTYCSYSRGQKFKTKVDFCVRSYLFRSIASEIIRDCIILSGERECDARDGFQS